MKIAKKFGICCLTLVMALSSVGLNANASHRHHHHHRHTTASVQFSPQLKSQISQEIYNYKQRHHAYRHHYRRHHHHYNHQFNRVFNVAKSKLGDHYVWGGTGPNTFDCAGFTQYIYQHGLHKLIPRTADAQYASFRHIPRHRAKAGDLVFFGKSKHNIEHVGMDIGHGQMIDAQNRGVIIEQIHVPWWHEVGACRPTHLH